MAKLDFREVDRAGWPDLVALFEGRGGPKSCWCMVWRARGVEARETKGGQRRAALESRVRDGVPIGLVGYLDGRPVAWCSIAPRSTYRPLGGPAEEEEEKESGIWSLACMFVIRSLRGEGLGMELIEAALVHARRKGAKIVEAYPVDPDSPSYRFMGFLPAFEAAGFRPVGRAGTRRHVVRRAL
jgi:GNAT superfamily N-acetyltransferase